MSKTHHRWFLLSLAHPVFSALCIFLGSVNSGAPGYAAALLAFLINLPGVFLINLFSQPTLSEASGASAIYFFAMIALTWLLVVVPACFLIARLLSNRRLRLPSPGSESRD